MKWVIISIFFIFFNLYGSSYSMNSVGDAVDSVIDDNTESSCTDSQKAIQPEDLQASSEDPNPSLCYDANNIVKTGFDFGVIDIMSGTTTPIINNSEDDLTDVIVLKTEKNLNFSGGEKIAIDDEEKTIAQDCDRGYIDENFGVNFGNKFGFGGGFEKGYVYKIDNFEHNSTHTVYDYAMGSFSLADTKFYAFYTKNGTRYKVELASCRGSGNNNRITVGLYDAWDQDSDAIHRIIKTKVVNKPFTLTIQSAVNSQNHYDWGSFFSSANGNEIQTMYMGDNDFFLRNIVRMEYRLYDIATQQNITNWQPYKGEGEATFVVNKAYKNVRVQFKYCLTPTEQKYHYVAHKLEYCQIHNLPYTFSFSTDNFAIRPYGFKIFGQNQYKRSGEDFNIWIKAVDKTNFDLTAGNIDSVASVENYNEALDTIDISASFYKATNAEKTLMQQHTGATDVDVCPSSGGFGSYNNSSFVNGSVQAKLIFTETGILSLNVKEVPGKEFALVDIDDTNDVQRYIKPATIIYDKSDIAKDTLLVFIPYKFVIISAEYNTTKQTPWIYMEDINNTIVKPHQAAYFDYEIEARNKFDAKVQNYTATCFPDTEDSAPQRNGLKLNTTFDLFLDANITVPVDVNLSFYTEDQNDSSAIWVLNKFTSLQSGDTNIRQWVGPLNFRSGVANPRVYFNVYRKVNDAYNPLKIHLNDVNTSISWDSNPGAPKEFKGKNSFSNADITFVYGRSYVPATTIKGAEGNVTVYYEIYCYKNDSLGNSCDASLLPDGNSAKVLDDPRWYINTKHNHNFGKAGSMMEKRNYYVMQTQEADGDLESGKNYDRAILRYNQSRGYPYKTTMLMQSNGWLIYNKFDPNAIDNQFDVRFNSDTSGWVGDGETNSATKTTKGIKDRKLTW